MFLIIIALFNKMFFSILLFFTSIFLFFYFGVNKNFLKYVFSVLVFFSICIYVFYFVSDYFTGNGIDNSVIYFIKYGISGAGFSEFRAVIFSSIIFLFLNFVLSFFIFIHKKNSRFKYSSLFVIILFLLSFYLNPGRVVLNELIPNTEAEYIFEADDNFYQKYNFPKLNKISENKNLIFIYAEGFERTYFDEKIFPSLTPNLKVIEENSVSFTNVSQDNYSSHTIAGLVASMCGIPLLSYSHSNSMNGMDLFLPSAICFSDLLKQENYYLSFIGGADLDFAGKGKFLKTHRFDEVNGLKELIPQTLNPDYSNGWGLFDDTIFDIAFNKYLEIANSKENFALFMLTLDTHHPEGMLSKSCENLEYEDNENPILNAVHCSDFLISNFINKIRSSGLDENTLIVVSSDHLALQNTASNLLNKGDRKNLFFVNYPENKNAKIIENAGLTLDTGTTVLSFLGFETEIGLGRNIEKNNRTENEINELITYIDDNSNIFLQFWNFPKLKNFIAVDLKKEKLIIDNREFLIPVHLEINEDDESFLRFRFNLPFDTNLTDEINEDARLNLIIDYCEKLGFEDLEKNLLCIFESKFGNTVVSVLEKNYFLSANDF